MELDPRLLVSVLNGIGCFEETVSLLEEVVVVNQLLLGRRVHAAKGVILP